MPAYQTAGFAYQGVGEFAYQDDGAPPPPPVVDGGGGAGKAKRKRPHITWIDEVQQVTAPQFKRKPRKLAPTIEPEPIRFVVPEVDVTGVRQALSNIQAAPTFPRFDDDDDEDAILLLLQ